MEMKTPLEIFYKYHVYHECNEWSFNYMEEEESVEAMNEYAIEVLTFYTDFLVKNGYCDTDVFHEYPTAIDRFMHPELNK